MSKSKGSASILRAVRGILPQTSIRQDAERSLLELSVARRGSNGCGVCLASPERGLGKVE